MRKISFAILLLAESLMAIGVCGVMSAKADGNAVMADNQVIKDEGYGNADDEYYNSYDDRVNDEENSVENSLINAQ